MSQTVLMLMLVISAGSSYAGILPTPKFIHERTTGTYFRIVVVDFSAEASDTAALIELRSHFGKDLRQTVRGAKDALTIHGRIVTEKSGVSRIVPAAIADSALASDEGYVIESNDRSVTIVARTGSGIFYGVASLLQLIERKGESYFLPTVYVADYPSLVMRGISDDISRGQISTLENFKKIIRFIAMYKMNVYMPYIENEFDFKSYPDFSKGRAPLTAKEVAELAGYAGLYHVRLIPIFETLGHMEDVLIKDEFQRYAEFPGSSCLNISYDSTYVFMKSILTEIAKAFPDNYFNMAADETWDVGLGASKQLVDSLGLARANTQHYKKIYDILKSLGKDVMMYGDIILTNPDILDSIPKDITIVDWHYGPAFGYPSLEKFRTAGLKFIASPAVWNFTGPFPNFYASYANIQYFAREALTEGALGLVVSTWNDNGGAELRELNYPGYAWSAECAWNPVTASPDTFESEFFIRYFHTSSDLPRIIYELLSSQQNLVDWNEFWRAPFLPMNNGPVPVRTESISATMPEVLSLIERAKKIVGANSDILDIYALVAKMNEYFASRINGIMDMREISSDSTMSLDQKAARINGIEQTLLSDLRKVRREYRTIYLKTNRPPMLQLIEMRFDDQEKTLTSGALQMARGNFNYNQKLESDFIYYPGSRPYSRSSSGLDSCTFFKTVNLDSVSPHADAQLIGDTYCKLFVNNQYVGKVEARRTLTLNVERQRVLLLDIGKYFHTGRNSLVIQAANYDRNGSPGCNFVLVVGRDTLSTDTSWSVCRSFVSPEVADSTKSVDAAVYDNGWTISAPDFGLKLKSWIER